jgi:hypothetical protein
MESSLWRPFGKRAVVDLIDLGQDRPPEIEWVVAKNVVVADKFHSFEEWSRRTGARLVSSELITSKVHSGPERWSLLRFNGHSEHQARRVETLGSTAN